MNPDTEKEVEFSQRLIGQWPEPMLLMDGTCFVDANPAAVELLGYPDKSALIGRSPVELSPDFQPDGERSTDKARALLSRARQGERLRFEWMHFGADGQEVWVDVTLSPVQQEGRRVFLCAWHDITALKEAERQARLANEALVRSNLELREFAQVAAHDLQTPLRTISVFTQLLHQEALSQLSEQAKQWSTLVVDGSRRMQALVEDLLAYSRLDLPGLPLRPVDARAALEEARCNLQRRIEEAGAVVVCGALPKVQGDRGQLVRVFQNLLENGLKYNASPRPRVSITARRQEAGWLFSVADNGIGIAPDFREQVFEMFRRLHTQAEYPGTGIGLAICRRVIERHGGRIWVEGGKGGGTVFRFTLAAAEEAA